MKLVFSSNDYKLIDFFSSESKTDRIYTVMSNKLLIYTSKNEIDFVRYYLKDNFRYANPLDKVIYTMGLNYTLKGAYCGVCSVREIRIKFENENKDSVGRPREATPSNDEMDHIKIHEIYENDTKHSSNAMSFRLKPSYQTLIG